MLSEEKNECSLHKGYGDKNLRQTRIEKSHVNNSNSLFVWALNTHYFESVFSLCLHLVECCGLVQEQ